MPIFHPLHTALLPPPRFTYPFNYTPHPLCQLAACELQSAIASAPWHEEANEGKMFGVLVVRTGDGRTGYLAAFSGLLAGCNHLEGFVPPVYDLLQPSGHFQEEERAISLINQRIAQQRESPSRKQLLAQLSEARQEGNAALESLRHALALAKTRRDELRSLGVDEAQEAAFIKESQHQKAELRRLKRAVLERQKPLEEALDDMDRQTKALEQERRQRSEALQEWLFRQFRMLNARGEERDLCNIFAPTATHVPPSGAGECCAPKLLQYAYAHHMQPLCMAEFWWGASPKAELRRHLNYYPACRGKCKPILEHMLQGLDVDPDPLEGSHEGELRIFFEDESLIVVGKPTGMLSVPGKSDAPSVLSLVKERCPEATGPMMVHRLDMGTSGLLVVAKTQEAYVALQRQFSCRAVGKRYVALLSRRPRGAAEGIISLPLRPDPLDRPRQVVDCEGGGKEAVTSYKIIGEEEDGRVRVALHPHTGRTHQLRVHCAHPSGLDAPIVGDTLYGTPDRRLMLHAEHLSFTHPVTGKAMEFCWAAEF